METPVRVEFALVPVFSLLALSCAVDALRAANLVLGRSAMNGACLPIWAILRPESPSLLPAISGCRRHPWPIGAHPAMRPN